MTTTTLQHDIDSGKATAHIVEVTPLQAAAWLERNTSNRVLRQETVDLYAADMAAGNWMMTGEAVKFGTGGEVLDGQHRLWAIVTASVAIRLMVMTGITPEAQRVMDSGVKRTAGDALKLGGHKYAGNIAAAARLGIGYDNGHFVKAEQHDVPAVTHSQVANWVDLNPAITDAAAFIAGGYFGRSRAAGTFGLYRLMQIDANDAVLFFEDLRSLRMGGKGDPRATLHHRLATSRHQRERMSTIKELHLVFRTWNAIRAGEELRQLKVLANTPFAEPSQ
jgi:hypothetical protein